jgi:predicted esterase
LLIAGLCLCAAAAVAAPPDDGNWPVPGQISHDVVLDAPSPLAANADLIDRLLSPRQRARTMTGIASRGQHLATFPIRIGDERFTVYRPIRRPPAGYGVLVFIPPSDSGDVPSAWFDVLDREGIIVVSAERSGNQRDIFARRIPLALSAVYAVQRRYPVDATRTYIGGFSGGSRVALRMILAYPDIFAGAVLNAGSDPIGTLENPLPSPERMAVLQHRTHIVMVTGASDEANIAKDMEAKASLAKWCVAGVRAFARPGKGHESIDPAGLSMALQALGRPMTAATLGQDRCLAAVDARLAEARSTYAALMATPAESRGEAELDKLDARYGSLLVER